MAEMMRKAGLIVLTAIVCLMTPRPAAGQRIDVLKVLAGVEKRYNSVSTLEVQFQQTYRSGVRPPQLESGILTLHKPGRMRWEYQSPAGKLFVVDGKDAWLYSPSTNRVERTEMKETEDLRVPLAFLLGRLDFQKHFGRFYARQEEGRIWVRGIPKSEKAPFEAVEFVVGPESVLERVVVAGIDNSTMEFRFRNERRNVALGPAAFRFVVPPGAEVIAQ